MSGVRTFPLTTGSFGLQLLTTDMFLWLIELASGPINGPRVNGCFDPGAYTDEKHDYDRGPEQSDQNFCLGRRQKWAES